MSYQPVRNPFPGLGPIPVGGSGFYPRVEALSAVQDLLRAGESVSLVGERKAGKTSFLNYLTRNLSPEEFIPVYVDAQRIMPQKDGVFLGGLIRSAAKAISGSQELDTQYAQTQPAIGDSSPIHHLRLTLLSLFDSNFNLDELKTFCFEIGVDYENLGGGDVKVHKARELIGFMQRRSLLAELIRGGRRFRGDINWPDVPDAPASVRQLPGEPAGLHVFSAQPDQVYRAFEIDLDELRTRIPIAENGNRRRVVWLIDEIETLQGFENTELFVYLRPLAQTDPDFRLVVAGYDVLYSLSTQGDWSPFYNAFRFQRLTALTTEVARSLVSDALAIMGTNASKKVIDQILLWSGRKPYYLKAVLAEIAAAMNKRGRGYTINAPLFEQACALFMANRDVDQIIRHQWEKHTTPRQRTTMSLMASRPHLDAGETLLVELRTRVTLSPDELNPQYLIDDFVRLEQLAFLRNDRGHYQFTSECLRQWIMLNKPLP